MRALMVALAAIACASCAINRGHWEKVGVTTFGPEYKQAMYQCVHDARTEGNFVGYSPACMEAKGFTWTQGGPFDDTEY